MQVDRVEVFHVAMPLIYPFRTAFDNTSTVESVLVKMQGGGLVGWGESAPWSPPLYSPEHAGGAFMMIRDFLAPRLVKQDIASGAFLQERLAPFKGNYFAKAALDLAWWDLYAKTRNEPLWKTIGGRGPVVEVGADIGVMDTLPQLLAEIEKALSAGFKRVKLKYRPGWEVNMVEAVRNRFPSAVFHVDCNSAYTLKALPMFRELDRFGLAMIEQPLAHDDIVDHAALAREIKTPVCLDESIVSPVRAEQAIRIGACRWVNIKHGRVGGLTQALEIHRICKAAGVGNWIGGMLESTVGQGFALALATLENVRYPADVFPTSRFYREDLGEPALDLSGLSQMTIPDVPGMGFSPHEGRLKKLALQKATVK